MFSESMARRIEIWPIERLIPRTNSFRSLWAGMNTATLSENGRRLKPWKISFRSAGHMCETDQAACTVNRLRARRVASSPAEIIRSIAGGPGT